MTNASWEDKFRLATEFLKILAQQKPVVGREVDEILPALDQLKALEDPSHERLGRESACQAKLAALMGKLSEAGMLDRMEQARILDIMEDIMVPL